jgi:hypothetical protein
LFEVIEKPFEEVFHNSEVQLVEWIRLPELINVAQGVIPKRVRMRLNTDITEGLVFAIFQVCLVTS